MSGPFSCDERSLLEQGARMLVGGVGDVGFEDLMDAWAAVSADSGETVERVRAAQLAAELAGDDLMAQSPWRTACPA